MRIREMPEAAFKRVCEIGFKHALSGMHLMKAGCLAAIEVMEGAPRELTRRRRDWSDVPPSLLEQDPVAVRVQQQFERYAGGERIKKREIVNGVAETLRPVLKDFRYYKASGQFRGSFNNGTSYVTLEYARGVLGIRFGVRHETIESLKHRLFGVDNSRPPHFPSTISKYSYNMGPTSPHWHYPTETTWPISGSEGLDLARSEIRAFVIDIVLPYVLAHREPLAIRSTFLHEPGHADTWFPIDATIFAIDYLFRKHDWVPQDYEALRQRFAKFVQSYRDELEQRYVTVTEKWNDAI